MVADVRTVAGVDQIHRVEDDDLLRLIVKCLDDPVGAIETKNVF
jgi:hypothetical protein